ncbi:MAG: c-type cytochrome [Verrucomicrobiota bacterium]|nr:c-type cytochrome [Verrucomicrobiota bacterium]
MKLTKPATLTCLSITLILAAAAFSEDRRPGVKTRAERFRHSGKIADEGPAGFHGMTRGNGQEAPTGFDNRTNGFLKQGPPFEEIDEDNVRPLRSFNDARFVFEEVEGADEGLGPTFNAQSCSACHQNVAIGGASQIAEHRTGKVVDGQFFESLGGSLIQSRATYAEIVERVSPDDEVRTFRMSTSTLGDGFVECIANNTLLAIGRGQPQGIRGSAPMVPVLEGDGTARLGRFGWKNQHASLQSFAADAYLNEMGITSDLFPEENTSGDKYVGFGTEYDSVPEPENEEDVVPFANFIRATKAPDRGEITSEVLAGEQLFNQVGCAVCHVPTIRTAPVGTAINGNSFNVPPALGNKIIHPYSDFLLHDIGTGDGIPILPQPEYASTASQIRTAPLWGLRTKNRLMHDGLSFTRQEAIERHAGQAASVTDAYNALTSEERTQLISFLDSL